MKKLKARIVVARPVDVLGRILEEAIERGIRRHNKYHETPISDSSQSLLSSEIENSFWLGIDESGLEIR